MNLVAVSLYASDHCIIRKFNTTIWTPGPSAAFLKTGLHPFAVYKLWKKFIGRSDADLEPSVASMPLANQTPTSQEKYSIFSNRQKRTVLIAGSFAAFFSPLASNVYFPALNTIAMDLRVSITRINLTVTTYQVSTNF